MSVDTFDVPNGVGGWLRDFEIDSAALTKKHTTWLTAFVVMPMIASRIRDAVAGSDAGPTVWTVRVIGGASRTAFFEHNLALSRRRAAAVETFLNERLANTDVECRIQTLPLSELPAAILGARDDVEDMVHRAVLVMVHRHVPGREDPPVPVRPPDRGVAVDFYVYAERGTFMNISRWQIEMYAVYRHKGQKHHVGWTGTASAASVSPGDVNKAWTPALPALDAVLAGPARVTFPSPQALAELNGKTIFPGARGGKFRLRIQNANPAGGDLILRMPFQTDVFELSQGVGSLGRKRPMPQKAINSLNQALFYLNAPRTKDGHIII